MESLSWLLIRRMVMSSGVPIQTNLDMLRLLVLQLAGYEQLIVFAGLRLLSVSIDNGEVLWSYPWRTGRFDVHAATPIFIAPDKIYISSGYGSGAAVVQVKVMNSPESSALNNRGEKNQIEVEEVWRNKKLQNRLSTSVLHGNHLYGFHNAILKCIDANTGTEKWKTRGFGEGTLTLAEDHLIILSDRGKLGVSRGDTQSLS